MSTMRPRIAVLTTPEVGHPDLENLRDCAHIVWSDEVGVGEALEGARAAFLWDTGMWRELQRNWGRCGGLEWVHAAVTGVEGICFEELRDSRVTLTNAAGTYDEPIAEYVALAVLAFERDWRRICGQAARHAWEPFTAHRVAGKSVLVVGPGHIGRACARKLAALGAHVSAVGRTARETDPDFGRVRPFTQLRGALAGADHIVVATPLTDETYHLIDAGALARCKPEAHLVNVGRGAVVDTAALVGALQSGHLGGATLDVVEGEPLGPASPLWDVPGLTLTPHLSGEVDGTDGALVEQFLGNAQRWLAGKPLANMVDKQRGYGAKG